jgi:hypothetical protein
MPRHQPPVSPKSLRLLFFFFTLRSLFLEELRSLLLAYGCRSYFGMTRAQNYEAQLSGPYSPLLLIFSTEQVLIP